MSTPRLRAIFLICDDVEGSAAFYHTLGFTTVELKSRSRVLSAGEGVELHLHERLDQAEAERYGVEWSRGSAGLVQCYEVDDLERLSRALPAESVLCGLTAAPWGDTILVVQDPDGHRLEFRQRVRTVARHGR